MRRENLENLVITGHTMSRQKLENPVNAGKLSIKSGEIQKERDKNLKELTQKQEKRAFQLTAYTKDHMR